ncbi:putative tryptophan--tRNA ligase [Helianthus anomalus]
MWKNLTVEESKRLSRENAKDIIACGFDVSRTFIFSDFDYVGGAFCENMVIVAKCVTYNKVVGIFGFTGEDHIGKISFPPVQVRYHLAVAHDPHARKPRKRQFPLQVMCFAKILDEPEPEKHVIHMNPNTARSTRFFFFLQFNVLKLKCYDKKHKRI